MPKQILALSPSQGRGGGIEAYVRELLGAIRGLGIEVEESALLHADELPGLQRKLHLVVQVVVASLRLRRADTQVLCLHPGLISVGLLSRRLLGTEHPVLVVLYGLDSWSAGRTTRRLLRSPDVRGVTISSFTAGSIARELPTVILSPGVPADLFEALSAIPRRDRAPGASTKILSVFRLSDYEAKGGPELVSAVDRLRVAGRDISLTIVGLDASPRALEADLKRAGDWLTVVRSPGVADLVSLYGDADIFVLATRQQVTPFPAGEGFGIVLAEAALAGLPVIAPANDGSASAIIDGVTGLRPSDQSAESLTTTLQWMLDHQEETAAMGRNGRHWARSALDPGRYPLKVAAALWGTQRHTGSLPLAFETSDIERVGAKAGPS